MRTPIFPSVAFVVTSLAAGTWLAAQAVQTALPATQAQAPARAAAPASKADLKPVVQDDRLLVAPPGIEIGPEGASKVTFTTVVPTPACRVYVGTLNAYATLDTTFFPVSVRETLTDMAAAHTVAIDLRRIESWLPPESPDGVREGEAYVRIEIFDPRPSAARYYERRARYAVVKGRYEARPAILLGPTLDLVTSTSATVSWDLDRPAVGTVDVWSADGKQQVAGIATEGGPAARHVVLVRGLHARSAYKYRVLVQVRPGGPVVTTGRFYAFRTAPAAKGGYAFAFLSDGRPSTGGGFINFNGVNAAVTPRLLADGYRRGAEFALFGGDLTAGFTSSPEHFEMMLDTWRLVADPVAHVMPIYEGIGNHESLLDFYNDALGNRYTADKPGDLSTESVFRQRFVNPMNGPEPERQGGLTGPPYAGNVYSFDFGNGHFVMLNTDYWPTTGGVAGDRNLGLKILGGNRPGYLMANQLAWLDRDLASARARGARFIFVAGHEPPFPVGGHVADAMWWNGMNDGSVPAGDVVDMRSRFLAIVNRYAVTALLFGHEHNYARLIAGPELDKALTRPITQFVSGGAGAPFYAEDTKAPWNKAIRVFAATNHYLLFTVSGGEVRFEAIDLDGRVIDSGVLK